MAVLRKIKHRLLDSLISPARYFIGVSFILLTVGMVQPRVIPSKEYQIKAVFLYNFTQFVEWPVSSFNEAESPLVIGVLGKNPFGTYLSETVRDEKINGHPLMVKYYSKAEDAEGCHILFVNQPKTTDLKKLLSQLKSRSVLTVSDASSFIQDGGMIQFLTKSNKIRLLINSEMAKTSGLTISSKLLRLSE